MKLLSIAAAASILSPYAATFAATHWQEIPYLRALSEIESGNNDYAVGKHKERSRFQIQRRSWELVAPNIRYIRDNYQNDEVAATVALKYGNYLVDLYSKRTKRGCITPGEFYVMWNAGPAYFSRKKFGLDKVPRKLRERAQRFENLVYFYQSKN